MFGLVFATSENGRFKYETGPLVAVALTLHRGVDYMQSLTSSFASKLHCHSISDLSCSCATSISVPLSLSLSSMTTSVKNNFVPRSLISNLQQVLAARNDSAEQQSHRRIADSTKPPSPSAPPPCAPCSGTEDGKKKHREECVKPVVLVTNAEGIESPGLTFLVEALVLDARLDVCVCAPQLLVLFIFNLRACS